MSSVGPIQIYHQYTFSQKLDDVSVNQFILFFPRCLCLDTRFQSRPWSITASAQLGIPRRCRRATGSAGRVAAFGGSCKGGNLIGDLEETRAWRQLYLYIWLDTPVSNFFLRWGATRRRRISRGARIWRWIHGGLLKNVYMWRLSRQTIPNPAKTWMRMSESIHSFKKKGSSSPYSYSSMTSDLGHVWSVICIISIPSLSLRQSTSSFHLLVFCVGAHLDFLIAHQMTPRPLTSDVPEDPETMIAGNAKNNTLRETLWKLILSWHHSHKHPVQ